MDGINTKKNNKIKEKILNRVYSIEKPASFSGINKLKKHTNFSKKNIKSALFDSDAYTLHKPITRKYKRRKVTTSGNEYQIQADLIDMQHLKKENKGYKFILTAIDVFSRYAWAYPLKSKKGNEVASVLKRIFQTTKGKNTKYFQTDKGTEFYNANVKKLLKEKNIHHFSTYNDEMKSSIVERFNRTLKIRLWKYFTNSQQFNYLDALPKFINSYNNTYHNTIKLTPSSVNNENMEKIWWNIYDLPDLITKKQKFNVGDYVRITSYKMTFDKGYIPIWREEIFKIIKKLNTTPITYKVQDLNNENIEGSFYSEELQHVNLPKEFKIEKIIRSRGTGKNREIFVKWKGYSNNFNSWIKATELNAL